MLIFHDLDPDPNFLLSGSRIQEIKSLYFVWEFVSLNNLSLQCDVRGPEIPGEGVKCAKIPGLTFALSVETKKKFWLPENVTKVPSEKYSINPVKEKICNFKWILMILTFLNSVFNLILNYFNKKNCLKRHKNRHGNLKFLFSKSRLLIGCLKIIIQVQSYSNWTSSNFKILPLPL